MLASKEVLKKRRNCGFTETLVYGATKQYKQLQCLDYEKVYNEKGHP
jgi:hypothetical protein